MATSSSLVLSSYRVGDITIDENRIRGEGGGLSPALVVPITVVLLNREQAHALALMRLEGSLFISDPPTSTQQISGPAVIEPLTEGGMWGTSPSAPVDHHRELRFPLNRELVRLLEDRAHGGTTSFDLELRFGVALAWVREEVADALPTGMGSAVDLLPVGWCRVETSVVHIPRTSWVTEILPALGGDHLRLVTIRLPEALGPLGREVASWFDQARARYDSGDYRSALERCRDLRHAVEGQLGAVDGRRVGERVALLASLPSESVTSSFLSAIWKSLVDLTNEAHHAKAPNESFRESARAGLLIAAVVLECLSDLLSPRRL